jgi:hypothetical protein
LLSVGKRCASDFDRLCVDQNSASDDCQKNSNRATAAVKPLGSIHSCGDYIIRSTGGVARLIPGSGLVTMRSWPYILHFQPCRAGREHHRYLFCVILLAAGPVILRFVACTCIERALFVHSKRATPSRQASGAAPRGRFPNRWEICRNPWRGYCYAEPLEESIQAAGTTVFWNACSLPRGA